MRVTILRWSMSRSRIPAGDTASRARSSRTTVGRTAFRSAAGAARRDGQEFRDSLNDLNWRSFHAVLGLLAVRPSTGGRASELAVGDADPDRIGSSHSAGTSARAATSPAMGAAIRGNRVTLPALGSRSLGRVSTPPPRAIQGSGAPRSQRLVRLSMPRSTPAPTAPGAPLVQPGLRH